MILLLKPWLRPKPGCGLELETALALACVFQSQSCSKLGQSHGFQAKLGQHITKHRRWSTDGKQRSSLFHVMGMQPNLHCTRVTTNLKLLAEDNEEDMKELNAIAGMHAVEMAIDETAMEYGHIL
jgi:hypothetical protein